MSEVKLLPCGHCGGRAEISDCVCDFSIHCTKCFITVTRRSDGINKFNAKKLAIKAWNAREKETL